MSSPRLQFEVQVEGGGPGVDIVDIIDIIDIPCYLHPHLVSTGEVTPRLDPAMTRTLAPPASASGTRLAGSSW